jgi:hypothetical protein
VYPVDRPIQFILNHDDHCHPPASTMTDESTSTDHPPASTLTDELTSTDHPPASTMTDELTSTDHPPASTVTDHDELTSIDHPPASTMTISTQCPYVSSPTAVSPTPSIESQVPTTDSLSTGVWGGISAGVALGFVAFFAAGLFIGTCWGHKLTECITQKNRTTKVKPVQNVSLTQTGPSDQLVLAGPSDQSIVHD